MKKIALVGFVFSLIILSTMATAQEKPWEGTDGCVACDCDEYEEGEADICWCDRSGEVRWLYSVGLQMLLHVIAADRIEFFSWDGMIWGRPIFEFWWTPYDMGEGVLFHLYGFSRGGDTEVVCSNAPDEVNLEDCMSLEEFLDLVNETMAEE